MDLLQYIDVGGIVGSLPKQNNPMYSSSIEIDVCLLNEDTIESGGTKKLRTNVGICNIPETYYAEFVGVKTSAGVWTKEGVLRNESYGYLFVYIHNNALESRFLPAGMKLGHISIKPFLHFTEHDYVDEIYMHNGGRHLCTTKVCAHINSEKT